MSPWVAWIMDHAVHKHLLLPVSGSRCQAQLANHSLWGACPPPLPTQYLSLVLLLVHFNMRPFTIEIDGAQSWLFFSLHRDIYGDGSMGLLSVISCFVLI